jgi:hypothetical protein
MVAATDTATLKETRAAANPKEKDTKPRTPNPRNGETKRQMEYAPKRKYEIQDTSIDVAHDEDPKLKSTDNYVLATSGVAIGLKLLIFYIPVASLAFPITILCALYMRSFPRPKESIDRTTVGWLFLKLVVFIFGLPYLVLCFTCYFWDCFWYYCFSVPYYFGRKLRCCARTGHKVSFSKSCKAIEPYTGGPSVLIHIIDILVAICGQTSRHGFVECAFKLAGLPMYVPWVKYYINTNPWLYQLDERYVQQISTSILHQHQPLALPARRKICSADLD